MRVGAIDVGTNSVHLVIGEISPEGEIQIIETGRYQVELGAGGLERHRLTPEAFERGLVALDACKAACDVHQVEDIHAAATSAVREAENGVEFCRAVKRRTGIHVRVISGTDEGQLVYLGARADLDFSPGRVLLMDLGGGSTEFVLCDAEQPKLTHSVPLGHIRLADLVQNDPLSADDLSKVKRTVREALAPLARRLDRRDFVTLVGTSGTMRCLARMATLHRGALLPEHGHGLVATRDDIDAIHQLVTSLPQKDIEKLPGMDPKRRRTIAAGTILVREVMKAWRIERFVTSERGLREGLLVDWILRHRPEIALSASMPDPRPRAVRATQERYGVDPQHAARVRSFATAIFDATARLHQLRPIDRELLGFGAELHDVGHHISGKSHNRHGQYLIRHTRMAGFTAPEVELLASLVRYHRGSDPKSSNAEFATLPRLDQRRVRILAGILRVADGLDRSHNQPIAHIEVSLSADELLIDAHTTEDAPLERWATVQRAGLLEQTLHRRLVLRLTTDEPAEAP